ncbi:MAG: primosomal protein N' [Candidatus Promineifilaceae bacterium]|nr:primosomal protein N' [Candidatus Promineifilaceae bacterium]
MVVMYAEIVVNIEAPLKGTFHYFISRDLAPVLKLGHLVEIEFGRRLAQGIVIGFDELAPVEETKPIISIIDDLPVVRSWQIELAYWLSSQYIAPLNSCLRLMLPPGITRWADAVYDINPNWDQKGRLTEAQTRLLSLLQEHDSLSGRQLTRRVGKKSEWKSAVDQLVRRGILRRGSKLDPPRVRPKLIKTAIIALGEEWKLTAATNLGRSSLQAELLLYLLQLDDPLPSEAEVLATTQIAKIHLEKLIGKGLVARIPGRRMIVPLLSPAQVPDEYRPLVSSLPLLAREAASEVDLLVDKGFAAIVDQPDAITLTAAFDDIIFCAMQLRGAETYFRILEYLAQESQPVPLSEIYSQTGGKFTHLRRLEQLEVVRFGTVEIWRDSLLDRDFVAATAPELTPDQKFVWSEARSIMAMGSDQEDSESMNIEDSDGRPAILLHGVTGSGKTEIYMRAIKLALQQGQKAIVLVPEIALTPQTVRRFAARFPGKVAILHSRLSDGERFDTWRRARLGLFDIVIGPRSALFAPLETIGVIVVDEEHDASYRQTPPVPAPYYHARETAVAAGKITGATVIMGSATPDVVSYHRAQSGTYRLLELPKRVMGHRRRLESQATRLNISSRYQRTGENPEDAYEIPLPPVQIIDLRQELRAGNRSIFSRVLSDALNETLERGEQAILFLNRRGTATFVMCRDCGHVLRCPRCDMPLTYHRPQMLLSCHHCGRQEPPHKTCPQCGSSRIKYFGLGTEEVESRVQHRWPEARITRWDRDTTAGKDTHDKLLASFINRESDILIGTQMIAKGLDLPFVTLVGVISADVSLGLPDYRTGERAFQLLAQVAGRAGRGLLGGRVVFQTYQPHHYAIQAAAEHDYAAFYLEEIRFRTKQMLPPFRRLAKLVLADPIANRGQRLAEQLASKLRVYIRRKALTATELIGPVPPYFSRVDGRYRWQIIIRTPDPTRLLSDFAVPKNWTLEVDPVSTL